MAERSCCTKCFCDPGLERNIIPSLSSSAKHRASTLCDYCGSRAGQLVKPAALQEYFEMLVGAYKVDDSGDSLVHLLRTDWNLFPRSMSDAEVKDLLVDILDDGEIVRPRYSPRYVPTNKSRKHWDELRDELMHINRWFLGEPVDLPRLQELLSLLLVTFDGDVEWFRARIQADDTCYPLEEMSAPPAHKAVQGRVNPAGIRYLYLGSDSATSAAEVRPHTGDHICVAKFRIPPIRVVDLRDPRTLASPFILTDSDEILQLRDDLPLLERLGEELAGPIPPKGSVFGYIPSQYLCEIIKVTGFDGVIYSSSVSTGTNLALFDPNIAIGVDVMRLVVGQIDLELLDAST